MKTLKVKNHKEFAHFDYVSEFAPTVKCGDVIYKINPDGPQIGVVLQTFADGDFRTDMFGCESFGKSETYQSEVRLATLTEISTIRPGLLPHLT